MTQNQGSLPLTIAQRIDAQCDRFEAEWQAGRPPRIEDLLASAAPAERSGLFRALLGIEVELLQRQGKPLDPALYRERFPGLAEVVADVFREVAGRTSSVEDLASRDTSVSRSSVRSANPPSETPTGPYRSVAKPGQVSQPSPAQIGRFEILATLGEGAFGKVYRARDPRLDREVALKVPRPGTLEGERDLERFLREARAAAALQHPNICPVYEVNQDGDSPYIVMAYIPGQSLAAQLKARKEPIPPRQAALIVRKLALALYAAHTKGVIHRDLKPSNIMFDRDRKDVVVMDFGLARRIRKDEAQLTQSGMIMGTPSYMAPEQARGDVKAIGPWSDVYSLGVILYEMLAGCRPFTGSVGEVLGQVLHVEPDPPSMNRPGLDAAIEAICMKALAKDPAKRYRSMKELADALNDYLRGTATAEPKSVAAAAPPVGSESRQLVELVQALSAERKAETAAAVEAAVAKTRLPLWKVLTGFGFMAALVLAGLFFFVNTGTATVIIHVPLPEGVSLKDASLSFFLDGKPIPAEELEKPIELKVGEHELLIKRGEQMLKRMVFVVGMRGKEATIQIKEEETGTLDRVTPILVPNYSFEEPDVRDQDSEGQSSYFTGRGTATVPGWTSHFAEKDNPGNAGVVDPGNEKFRGAGRNPGVDSLPASGHGHQCGFITLPKGTGSLITTETLAKVADNTIYVLTVAVGYSLDSPEPGLVSLELLVGDQVAGSTTIPPEKLLRGGLADFSASFMTSTADMRKGLDLRVRLSVTGGEGPFKYVQPSFDNVRLVARPADLMLVFDHPLSTAETLDHFNHAEGWGSKPIVVPDTGLRLSLGNTTAMVWPKVHLGDRYRVQFEAKFSKLVHANWTLNGPGYGSCPFAGYWCSFNQTHFWIHRADRSSRWQVVPLPTPIPLDEWVSVQAEVNQGTITITINGMALKPFQDAEPLTGPLHGWFGLANAGNQGGQVIYRNLRIWSPTSDPNRDRQFTPPVTEKPLANGKLLYEFKLAGGELGPEWWQSHPRWVSVEGRAFNLSGEGTNDMTAVILDQPLHGNIACEIEFENPIEMIGNTFTLWYADKLPHASKDTIAGWLTVLRGGGNEVLWHRGRQDVGEFDGFYTRAPQVADAPFHAPISRRRYLARLEFVGDTQRIFLDGGLLMKATRPVEAVPPGTPAYFGLRQFASRTKVHALRIYQIPE